MVETLSAHHALFEAILDPARRRDPYPAFDDARQAGPLVLPDHHAVAFGRFTDCDEILRHPDFSVDYRNSTPYRLAVAEGADPADYATHSFLELDPPDHTRLRKLVSKAFSPPRIRELQHLVDGLLEERLPCVAQSGDLIADLAYPLPVAVICRMLGIPVEDEPRFGHASKLIAQGLDDYPPVRAADGDPQERRAAVRWMRDYLRSIVDRRRRDPRDDLVSALVAAEEAGDRLTTDELIATCELLFIAGHETTVNLIANAALAALTHPGQWRALAENPDDASAVVEETLRWDPPVQLTARFARTDVRVANTVVTAGEMAIVLIGAAQRDPATYEHPDAFDPQRPTKGRHLAFGRGIHACLGAQLARMEAVSAIRALTARFPGARLAGEPTYRSNVTLRGMTRLPIVTGPAAPPR